LEFENKRKRKRGIGSSSFVSCKWVFFSVGVCVLLLAAAHSDLRLKAFVAVLLVMFNKAALSSYKFPCANVLTVMQVSPTSLATELSGINAVRHDISPL
jgi:hypothetical protein